MRVWRKVFLCLSYLHPKGMWQRTYQRKRFEIEWCEHQADCHFIAKFAHLLSPEDRERFLMMSNEWSALYLLARSIRALILTKHHHVCRCCNLTNIIKLSDHSCDLVLPLETGKTNKPEILSTLMDQINGRYGGKIIPNGIQQEHFGFFDREWLPIWPLFLLVPSIPA